jgi:cyclopropane fatty-acyl-phospholipid synthase-like methyltransferase
MTSKARELLLKMRRSHEVVYNADFWSAMDEVLTGRNTARTSTARTSTARTSTARTSTARTSTARILELACGPGLFGKHALERYDVAELMLTDVSRTMVRHARRVIASVGTLVRTEVRRLDFDSVDWSLPRNAYDVAFIGLAFRNTGNPVQFLETLRTHLIDDGVLVVYDYLRVAWSEFRDAWGEYVGMTNADHASTAVAFNRFRNLTLYTVEDIHAIAEQSAYHLRRVEEITAPMRLYFAVLTPDQGGSRPRQEATRPGRTHG